MKSFILIRVTYHTGGNKPSTVEHFFPTETQSIENAGKGEKILQRTVERITLKGDDFVRFLPGCSPEVKRALCNQLVQFTQEMLESCK